MTFSFHHHLHLYCERAQSGFLGEPVNTLSSLGFILAAYLLWRHWRKSGLTWERVPEVPILIAITVAIGLGSAFFHSDASMGSVLFDVIPIAFFVFFYLYVFARRLLGLGLLGSTCLFLLLVSVNIVYKFYVFRSIDGYVSYIPTFLFLLALSLYMLVTRHPSALRFTCASFLALVSLYFRMIDRTICYAFPIGTHFLWHLFNAVVIYILVQELMSPQFADAFTSGRMRK